MGKRELHHRVAGPKGRYEPMACLGKMSCSGASVVYLNHMLGGKTPAWTAGLLVDPITSVSEAGPKHFSCGT